MPGYRPELRRIHSPTSLGARLQSPTSLAGRPPRSFATTVSSPTLSGRLATAVVEGVRGGGDDSVASERRPGSRPRLPGSDAWPRFPRSEISSSPSRPPRDLSWGSGSGSVWATAPASPLELCAETRAEPRVEPRAEPRAEPQAELRTELGNVGDASNSAADALAAACEERLTRLLEGERAERRASLEGLRQELDTRLEEVSGRVKQNVLWELADVRRPVRSLSPSGRLGSRPDSPSHDENLISKVSASLRQEIDALHQEQRRSLDDTARSLREEVVALHMELECSSSALQRGISDLESRFAEGECHKVLSLSTVQAAALQASSASPEKGLAEALQKQLQEALETGLAQVRTDCQASAQRDAEVQGDRLKATTCTLGVLEGKLAEVLAQLSEHGRELGTHSSGLQELGEELAREKRMRVGERAIFEQERDLLRKSDGSLDAKAVQDFETLRAECIEGIRAQKLVLDRQQTCVQELADGLDAKAASVSVVEVTERQGSLAASVAGLEASVARLEQDLSCLTSQRHADDRVSQDATAQQEVLTQHALRLEMHMASVTSVEKQQISLQQSIGSVETRLLEELRGFSEREQAERQKLESSVGSALEAKFDNLEPRLFAAMQQDAAASQEKAAALQKAELHRLLGEEREALARLVQAEREAREEGAEVEREHRSLEAAEVQRRLDAERAARQGLARLLEESSHSYSSSTEAAAAASDVATQAELNRLLGEERAAREQLAEQIAAERRARMDVVQLVKVEREARLDFARELQSEYRTMADEVKHDHAAREALAQECAANVARTENTERLLEQLRVDFLEKIEAESQARIVLLDKMKAVRAEASDSSRSPDGRALGVRAGYTPSPPWRARPGAAEAAQLTGFMEEERQARLELAKGLEAECEARIQAAEAERGARARDAVEITDLVRRLEKVESSAFDAGDSLASAPASRGTGQVEQLLGVVAAEREARLELTRAVGEDRAVRLDASERTTAEIAELEQALSGERRAREELGHLLESEREFTRALEQECRAALGRAPGGTGAITLTDAAELHSSLAGLADQVIGFEARLDATLALAVRGGDGAISEVQAEELSAACRRDAAAHCAKLLEEAQESLERSALRVSEDVRSQMDILSSSIRDMLDSKLEVLVADRLTAAEERLRTLRRPSPGLADDDEVIAARVESRLVAKREAASVQRVGSGASLAEQEGTGEEPKLVAKVAAAVSSRLAGVERSMEELDERVVSVEASLKASLKAKTSEIIDRSARILAERLQMELSDLTATVNDHIEDATTARAELSRAVARLERQPDTGAQFGGGAGSSSAAASAAQHRSSSAPAKSPRDSTGGESAFRPPRAPPLAHEEMKKKLEDRRRLIEGPPTEEAAEANEEQRSTTPVDFVKGLYRRATLLVTTQKDADEEPDDEEDMDAKFQMSFAGALMKRSSQILEPTSPLLADQHGLTNLVKHASFLEAPQPAAEEAETDKAPSTGPSLPLHPVRRPSKEEAQLRRRDLVRRAMLGSEKKAEEPPGPPPSEQESMAMRLSLISQALKGETSAKSPEASPKTKKDKKTARASPQPSLTAPSVQALERIPRSLSRSGSKESMGSHRSMSMRATPTNSRRPSRSEEPSEHQGSQARRSSFFAMKAMEQVLRVSLVRAALMSRPSENRPLQGPEPVEHVAGNSDESAQRLIKADFKERLGAMREEISALEATAPPPAQAAMRRQPPPQDEGGDAESISEAAPSLPAP